MVVDVHQEAVYEARGDGDQAQSGDPADEILEVQIDDGFDYTTIYVGQVDAQEGSQHQEDSHHGHPQHLFTVPIGNHNPQKVLHTREEHTIH